jgi:glutamine cyclotransferase
MKKILAFTAIVLLISACNNGNDTSGDTDTATATNTIAPPANITYNIVAAYPHDTSSFTEGLIWQNNSLYESTGLEGKSRLMKINIKNGKATDSVILDNSIFGEGITLLDNKIYQLTWVNHKVYVYDAKTLKKIKELTWAHDGWGLTTNGTDLIISTGESNIYFVDPETFKIRKTLGVSDNNGPVGNLNELEFINGVIYANIYLYDYIVKIDPANGNILGKIDLSSLRGKAAQQVDTDKDNVLNGIAYDSAKKSLYVTGKNWPVLFEMKVN